MLPFKLTPAPEVKEVDAFVGTELVTMIMIADFNHMNGFRSAIRYLHLSEENGRVAITFSPFTVTLPASCILFSLSALPKKYSYLSKPIKIVASGVESGGHIQMWPSGSFAIRTMSYYPWIGFRTYFF